MKKLILFLILLLSCQKEETILEIEYSVFSEVSVVSSIFDDIGVTDVRAFIYTQVNGDTVVVERQVAVEEDCAKVSMSGNIFLYEKFASVKLWATIYFRFEDQGDGWTYLPTLSKGSLDYVDVELGLGIMDSEFRRSKVIAFAVKRSTNTNKEVILEWTLPEIEME